MEKTRLGKSGLVVSRVGFGGIPIMRVSDDEAVQAIRHALELGVNFIDTAAAYGDSQHKIGLAIQPDPQSVVIASKSGAVTRDGVLRDIEKGLADIGRDTFDLYQLHGANSPERWGKMRGRDGALEGMIEALEQGMIRHIGVTSHSLELAIELAGVDVFETMQFPFNLVTREPEQELIPKCRERDLGFIVMKPLCGGQYANARLAFRFLNGFPDLVPIPGIETAAEIEEIAAFVADGATLTGDELAEAEAVAARLGKLFCRRCGYCEPCAQGVPVQLSMIFGSLAKRLPTEKALEGPGARVLEHAPKCIECGACEKKCPYNLPIMETIKTQLALARQLRAG